MLLKRLSVTSKSSTIFKLHWMTMFKPFLWKIFGKFFWFFLLVDQFCFWKCPKCHLEITGWQLSWKVLGSPGICFLSWKVPGINFFINSVYYRNLAFYSVKMHYVSKCNFSQIYLLAINRVTSCFPA